MKHALGPPGISGIIAATTPGHMESAPTCKSVDDTAAAHEHGPAGLATKSTEGGAGGKQ